MKRFRLKQNALRIVSKFALLERVGGEGIEPPTRGFSVLCSTD